MNMLLWLLACQNAPVAGDGAVVIDHGHGHAHGDEAAPSGALASVQVVYQSRVDGETEPCG